MAEASAARGSAPEAAVPLNDVMLAMDVVDSLRHADKLIESELTTEQRDQALKERLRTLYAAQGIEVPERILNEGVAALREDRFAYHPLPPGMSRTLALLWVRRGRWLKGLALAMAIGAIAVGGWYVAVELPAERQAAQQARELSEQLPRRLTAELDRIIAISKEDQATRQAREIAAQGAAALQAGDAAAAREATARLTALREQLEQSYTLRILAKPGQQSGVWRVPRANPSGRNYYILVEAVDAQGRPVMVPVTSEEDNQTAKVSVFGIRVDESTFNRVRADKQDDGIIQNNRFGEKRVGEREPRFNFSTPGGKILQW